MRIIGILILIHCGQLDIDQEFLEKESLKSSLYNQNQNIHNSKYLKNLSFNIMDDPTIRSIAHGFWIETYGWGILPFSANGKIELGKTYSIRFSDTGKYSKAKIAYIDVELEIAIAKIDSHESENSIKLEYLDPVDGVKPLTGSILHCIISSGEFIDYFHEVIVAKDSESNLLRKDPSQSLIPTSPYLGDNINGGLCIDLQGKLAGIPVNSESIKPKKSGKYSFLLPVNSIRDSIVGWEEYQSQNKEIFKGIIPVPILTVDLQKKLDIGKERGVLVSMVEIPSAAHSSKLKRYDLIQEVNQKKIQSVDQLYLELKKYYKLKDPILIKVLREGKTLTLELN